MTIECPKCRHEFDLREASVDDDWRAIINLLPAFGPHAKLAFEYVELFGITPLKKSTKKLLRLLEGLSKLIMYGKFTYQQKTYEISEEGIVEALKVVCNKRFAEPLENHNYLKKVMITLSQEARRPGGQEAVSKRQNNQGPVYRELTATDTDHGHDITAEEFKRKRGIASLAGSVGKRLED